MLEEASAKCSKCNQMGHDVIICKINPKSKKQKPMLWAMKKKKIRFLWHSVSQPRALLKLG